MLEKIEGQHAVENVLTDDFREMDNLREKMDVVLEATRKSQEHAVQMLSHIANPKTLNQKICALGIN